MALPTSELVALLTFLIAWDGGVLPVFLDGARTPTSVVHGRDAVEVGERLHTKASRWDLDRSAQVEIGLPRASYGAVRSTTVLWATVEDRRSLALARGFRPAPSMVLALGKGSRRIVLWGLREPLAAVLAESSNRRIAYRLRAPYGMCDPDLLRIPVPGTFLRVGRRRPAPAVVTHADPQASYTGSQLTATLKDPPRPWVERQRESGAWR